MFRLTLGGLLVLALGLPIPTRAQESKKVAALIGQLGARDFRAREQATKALEALGSQALEALRQACKSDSAEVRWRAAGLVRRIERRLASEQLLTPTKIRLNYKDTPLDDVLQDLMKRTGVQVRLQPGSLRAALRKVTLDTGEGPFWEALAQLCAKAGVREVEPPRAAQPAPRGGGVSVTIVGGGLKPETKDIRAANPNDRPLIVTLADGAAPSLPTYLAGSVRLRALTSDPDQDDARKPGELLATLHALAEPALRWHEILSVRIERAVDDQGQVLKGRHVPAQVRPAARGGGMVVINGQVITADNNQPRADASRIALHFQVGARPAKLLKEVSGTISAQMLSAPKALVTVDNVLTASGKTFQGPHGVVVRVGTVKRGEDGQVTVTVAVEPPAQGTSDGSAQKPPNMMNIIVNGRRIGEPEETLSAANFALLDGKGKRLEVARAVSTGKFAGRSREYELTYRQATGEPLRFLYLDRSPVVVEVPFTLRDVPLR
ncbi:MAG: hypothetical protein L0Z62_16975 [Gemmataceae bacterium]|nr:hypothetical protein [Gemmataceae bacterium]